MIATDINIEPLQGVANLGIRALDVTDTEAVNRAVSDAGEIDVLFNCAGIVDSGSVLEASHADLDFAFALKFRAMFDTIRAVLPDMLERGRGSIINIDSVASSMIGVSDRCDYPFPWWAST